MLQITPRNNIVLSSLITELQNYVGNCSVVTTREINRGAVIDTLVNSEDPTLVEIGREFANNPDCVVTESEADLVLQAFLYTKRGLLPEEAVGYFWLWYEEEYLLGDSESEDRD